MGTNETTSLLPCPFCGASASMRHGSRFSHWVQCDKCGAGHPFAFDTEDGAAAAWNSRAPEADRADRPAMSAPITDAEREADIKAKWRADCAERRAL
jgi:Lar family restriction alleviation protein